MDKTTYAEFNFGGGKSPQEVEAELKMQNTIMYSVIAIVVLVVVLVVVKMFKKK